MSGGEDHQPANAPLADRASDAEKPKGVRRPWGLRWRSSIWFITLAVGIGVTTDILVYSMIVPIVPFRLEELGYHSEVSGLVGWLLFAYSAALVVSTPPIAYLSERYKNRKIPLLCGQVALIGSQIMLMEAPMFWVMTLARVAQGISASVIWVVGLALVCDTVPEAMVGKHMGLVMMGMSLGNLAGPPVAGALDQRFGFRGPFILGIIITTFEFVCRLLIIERHEAALWDSSLRRLMVESNASRGRAYGTTDAEKRDEQPPQATIQPPADEEIAIVPESEPVAEAPSHATTLTTRSQPPAQLSILLKLVKSPRAMAPALLALAFGIIITSQEPVVPLYLRSIYGLTVDKIGLVYLAVVIPTFISSPLSGWYSDRGGTTLSTLICLMGTIPFWVLIFIKGPLAYFIVMFGCLYFFASALISPITAEFASASRSMDGVGFGHTYGAFNVAYGIGSAIGPVIGGQIYDHATRSWMALNLFDLGMVVTGIIVVLTFFGERPLLNRGILWLRRRVK
ncbi:MFS general substrate transporter [Fomes fomentarius]|nr:MFS general substrate transporter [Fomes fomentarius]